MSASEYHFIQCSSHLRWTTDAVQSAVHVRFEQVVEWDATSYPHEQVACEADFTFRLSYLFPPDGFSDAIYAAMAGVVSCPSTATRLTDTILSQVHHELRIADFSHTAATMFPSLRIDMTLLLNTIRIVGDEEVDRLYLQQVENSENAAGGGGAAKASIKALERVKFAGGEGEYQSTCAICVHDFFGGREVTKMPCRHLFHHTCIQKWLQRRNSCPLCRFVLPAPTPS